MAKDLEAPVTGGTPSHLASTKVFQEGVDRRPIVLVVDDEPDHLALLAAHLRRAGCAVLAVPDGEQALRQSKDTLVQLIVLDLRLPGLDGWQLTSALRAHYPGCPIVISSVLDVEAYPEVDGVLPKPVSGAQVLQLVSRFIGTAGEKRAGRG